MKNIHTETITSAEMIKKIFDNPKSSKWIKIAIKELLELDPMDVEMDLAKLTKLFNRRLIEKFRIRIASASWGRIK